MKEKLKFYDKLRKVLYFYILRHKKLFLRFYNRLIKILNACIPKHRKWFYCIPNTHCIYDKYDVINYSSDNVLTFINYLLKKKEINNCKMFIEIYQMEKINEYIKYVESFKSNIKVVFVKSCDNIEPYTTLNNKIKFSLKRFFKQARCRIWFTAVPYYNFSYKTKSQVCFCLNYGSPFKYQFKGSWAFYSNLSYDYVLCTSRIMSLIASDDYEIDYKKFLNYGYPRNDNLKNNLKSNKVKEYIECRIKKKYKKLIFYTPTHKTKTDYTDNKRYNIIGYDNDLMELSELLEKYQAILMIKLHPIERKNLFININYPNILLWEPNEFIGMYDVMANTDVLITDYTSAYQDFLLLDKPVIFNFYDIEKYKEKRGFSLDPIELFIEGDIVKKWSEFLNSIENKLSNETAISNRTIYLKKLYFKYNDFNASQRLFNKMKELKLI